MPITPRVGLVDTLAPQSSSAPFADSLTSSAATSTTPCVTKEVKKAQLKDRMASAAAPPPTSQASNQQPTLPPSRIEVNSARNDHISHTSSVKGDKIRTEGNGSAKLDSSKQRQNNDPTCSAARTDIHHIAKTDANKASFRSENHTRAESNPARNDHAVDASKLRTETPKASAAQVRPESVPSRGESSLPASKPSEVDLIKPNAGSRENSKAHQDAEGSKNRTDFSVSKTNSMQTKPEELPSDLTQVVNAPTKSVKPSKSSPSVSSTRTASLVSFVDSGFPWKEEATALDLSEDSQTPKKASKPVDPVARSEAEPVVKSSIAPPKMEDVEDQESLLQRDLAMVLEEISQINQQFEIKDQPQSGAPSKSTESRTKSVIKTTGRASPGVSVPPLTTPSVTSKPSVSSVSAIPPRLTAATRTPPPVVSPSLNRISPTGSTASTKVISSIQPHSSSLPSTPSSGEP